MLFERMFGNIYGYIWLLIFLAAVVALILWIVFKKENNVKIVSEEKKEEMVVKEAVVIEETSVAEEKKENNESNEYEIIESEDGFFRVKKVGNERTLRKFSTRIEALNFIDKKGIK